MRKQVRIVALICALGLVIGGAYLLSGHILPEETVELPIGEAVADAERFLDFSAEDQAGNPVYLSDFIDRATVVYFWTSWCGFCTLGMDELELLYESMGEQVQILAVNLSTWSRGRDEAVLGRLFMEEADFSFFSIYDANGEAAELYGITAVPMLLFIDANGRLTHQQLGFLSAEAMEAHIPLG